ncbi:hypothetical protein D5F01_LYC17063 [Xyrichtys novacula]|uniref:Uncharacterized protein n=1 Tax=Xyrichtys novacula TaxID=13765 RepID=A0AAV1H7E9_XYRNO|nr:hypothetical protein D5F01_LYC17063 [Xyrichtys novacula]
MSGYNTDWTEVRYGRRARRFRQQSWDRRDGYGWGKARAFPAPYGRRDRVPSPYQPVPPPRPARFYGPQSKTYASVVGRQFNPRPAPRFYKNPPVQQHSDNIRRQPADPQFGRLVRTMHSLIKIVHHYQNVAPKAGKGEPKIISRMVEVLATMIKPAVPTQRTMEFIKGNAENWGYNTVTILMDHYKDGLDVVLGELEGILIPRWKDAFEVAVRWAKRNLPRITADVIDHAEALITERAEALLTERTEVREEAPQPTVQKNITLQSLRGTKSHGLNIQPPAKQSVATMTEQVQQTDSEWASSPKEQRQAYRGRKGVVLPEDEVFVEEVEEVEEQPRVIHDQILTNSQLATLFDELDAEEERERLEARAAREPPKDSEQQTSTPNQTEVQVQVLREAFPEPAEVEALRSEDPGPDLDDGDVFQDSSDRFLSPEPERFKVNCHSNTQRKLTEWDLVVEKKYLIIGDSNLKHIPPYFNKNLQIDSFPGSHFRHAQTLMEKTAPPQDLVVEKVVLAFGINARENKSDTTIKNVQGAIRSTKRSFPYAQVWVL